MSIIQTCDPRSGDGGGAQGANERRNTPRFTLLIRAAKLIAGDSEQICIIRDASVEGIRVRLFGPLLQTEGLELDLANGERFAVDQVWSEGENAGFQFRGEVDLARLVEVAHGRHRKRELRVRARLEGRIHTGTQSFTAQFENLSRQGACIECEERLSIDQLVRVETGHVEPFFAKARWRRQPRYGLIFEETLSFEDLASLTLPEA